MNKNDITLINEFLPFKVYDDNLIMPTGYLLLLKHWLLAV